MESANQIGRQAADLFLQSMETDVRRQPDVDTSQVGGFLVREAAQSKKG